MCSFVIQKTASPPDNWHPLCYSPKRYTSQNGVHSDEKRYSKSDMQIKHYLCSAKETLQKLQFELSLQHRQAEGTRSACVVQSSQLQPPHPGGIPGQVNPRWSRPSWILLQPLLRTWCLASEKCRQKEGRMEGTRHHCAPSQIRALTSAFLHIPWSSYHPTLCRAKKKPRNVPEETPQPETFSTCTMSL